jgi:hypothetical protein
MSCQVNTSGQCQLRNKKTPIIVLLPTDSVIVDNPVFMNAERGHFPSSPLFNVGTYYKQRDEEPAA